MDLSKLLTYDFHHNYTKTRYGCGAKLLFTDSLVYEIETDDLYKDFYKDKSLFDFSDYPKDSRFYDPINKKVIGKMKDKVKGIIMDEFDGLKYSLVAVDNEEIKKAKGVSKIIVDSIRHKNIS